MDWLTRIKNIFKRKNTQPEETKDERLYEILTSDEYKHLTEDDGKLAAILEVAKLLYDAKECLVFTSNVEKPDPEQITFYSLTDNPTPEFEMGCRDIVKMDLVNRVGPEEYDKNIEYYDNDRAMLYKEADYHILRADYFEKYLEYYKRINDPNGDKANDTHRLYQQVMYLKEQYEKFN